MLRFLLVLAGLFSVGGCGCQTQVEIASKPTRPSPVGVTVTIKPTKEQSKILGDFNKKAPFPHVNMPTTRLFTTLSVTNGDSDTTVRVFVNKPDANAQTSLDDPSYVTSVAFYPKSYRRPRMNFLTNLSLALSRLAFYERFSPEAPLSITFVAVPDASLIVVDGVSLEVEKE